MRIVRDRKNVIFLMADGEQFEIACPDVSTATRLVSILEIGIADTVEQLMEEQDDGSFFSGTEVSPKV